MKTMIGLTIALMLSGTGAYAQGGPGEKMQGSPGMREQGPGDAGMRGGGPDAQQRTEPSSEERGKVSPKGDREGKQAQEKKEDNSSKGRAEKDNQPARAEKEDKSRKTNERVEERSRTDKEKSPQTTEGKPANDLDQSAERKEKDQSSDTSKQATSGDRKGDAKHVDLSGEKQDRIKTAFRSRSDLKHRTNVSIDLRVGTRLPHDWDFVFVPDDVVAIVPEYRGYRFAYVDDYYVICDPDTYEIVAVIPATGGPSYASDSRRGECSERISLNADDRDFIIRAIERESHAPRVDVPHLTVGWSVPREIELQSFPEPVISQISELGSCRYFVAEDKIAVVSPDEEKVVAVIDRS
jgi:hypothetical protein